MKIKILVMFFVTIFLLSGVYAAEQTFISSAIKSSSGPNIIITSLRYEPYPVSPGDYFDIWFEIENTGQADVEDLVVNFVDNYPFFLDVSEKPSREFSRISPGQIVVVKYKVRVDQSAIEETSELKIRYKHKNMLSQVESYNIEIASVNPVFFIETSTNPERLKQGEKGVLSFKLTNSMSSLMNDISIKLNLNDLPFTPIGSSSERKIGKIASSSSEEVQFDIMPSPKAASGIYKIPVEINYYDKGGMLYTKNDIIGVLVDDDAEFQLNLEESEVLMNGNSGKIVVSISNIAESDVKFLSLELLESDYYKGLSNPRIYIGNLQADDFETAEFKIFVRKSTNGKVPLRFLINYKDPFNQAHTNTKIVGLPIYSYFQATSFGLVKKNFSIISLIFTFLIILYIFRTYKEWRKQRDIEKAIKITALNFYDYGKKNSLKILRKVYQYLINFKIFRKK